jgi:PAS domain S-box-containing protein
MLDFFLMNIGVPSPPFVTDTMGPFMTPASLKTKLTLHIPLAACLMTALFLGATQYFLLHTDAIGMTATTPQTRQLFLWGSATFLLLLFLAMRYLLARAMKPLFAFIHHLEQLPTGAVDGEFDQLPAYRELAFMESTFNELIVQRDEQRREAERHEQLYRTVVECSSELMFWTSADHRTILYISPHCQELTGYQPDDFYADDGLLERVVHPDFRQRWQEHRALCSSCRCDSPIELALVTRQGRTVWVNHTCKPLFNETGECCGVRGSFNDITHIRENDQARQASEEALRLQNDYLRALHETTLGLIGRLELHSLLSAIIARAAALMETDHGFIYLLNKDKTEMELRVKLGFFETLEPTPLKPGEGIAGYVWEQKTPCATSDYRQWVTGADISLYDTLKATAGVPLTSGDEVIGVIGLSYTAPNQLFDDRKITLLQQFAELVSLALDNARLYDSAKEELEERTRAEERLRKLSHAVMQCPVSIMITDLRGNIEFANPQVSRLTGYEPDELLGRNTRLLKSGLTSQAKYENLWDTILSGRQWKGELQNRNKNGQLYWERALISPIRDADGAITHFIAIQEDISDLKILENQLRHSQKMEAIGQLAGGIAHDFNNILTAILGYGNILLMKLPPDSPSMKTAEQILAAAERGAGLTQGLLTFSRKQTNNLIRIDLNTIIERVEKLLTTLISENSTLISHLSKEPLPVMADSMQIEQVLINLATNMRDSMPDGGTVTISTELVSLETEFMASYGFGNGRFVHLSMSDTGHGMNEETIRRIFEPFYTTKEIGKGTGLGLSVVYGIVKKHNGHILCTSKPGEGSNFSVYLPVAEEDTAQQPPSPPPPPVPVTPANNNVILLADFDETSRKRSKSLLEEFGYRVVEATNGAMVVETYQEQKKPIHVVILDSIAPGETGVTTYREIRNSVPAEKIIFCCCNPQDAILDTLLSLDKNLHYISKPFPPKELLMKIREVVKDAL